MQQNVVIVDAARTAIGTLGGQLSGIPASSLGAKLISELLKRTEISGDRIDEVILGQVLTAGAGQNPARQTALEAGLPDSIPAMTINKVCGSGLKAIHLATQAICCGDAEFVIAGGQENMSMAPHVLPRSRMGTKMGNWELIDSMVSDGLWDAFNDYHMGVTAENIAKEFSISRAEQDEFAAASQNKVEKAQQAGIFREEIIPYEIPQRKGEPIIFDTDEFPRSGTTVESLSKLRPAFDKAGTVTAGNASGINDGAAIVILTTQEHADALGLKPLARIAAYASAGVNPAVMGTGPIPASKRCLEKAGWTIDDLDLIEANEAFAAQAISVNRKMGWDTAKVNVNGGAIALGHPIGASGARVLVSLLYEMQRRNAGKGLATLCIGGGQGVALAVERSI